MTVNIITTVISAAQDYSLVTLEEIKSELGIDPLDTSNDDWLTRSKGQVSRSISSYCNRVFPVETVIDQVYIDQDPYPYQIPGGIKALQLSRWPVQNLSDVEQTISAITTKALIADKDFKLDALTGHLYRLNHFTGVQTIWEPLPIAVTYDGGFPAIPDDVAVAALRWVVWRWNERSRDPTLKSIQQPDFGTQSFWVGGPPMSGGVPEEIASLLGNYRVPVVF